MIALDFARGDLRTEQDYEQLFNSLATLETWRLKKSVVKGSRWFSWHQACCEHYEEFFATRMLLTWAYPHEKSPDEGGSKMIKDLRKDDLGGLKLALQCLSWKSWYGITILKLADASLWEWYSNTVKMVKNPTQGLERCLESSVAGWMIDGQFQGLVGALLQEASFEKVRIYGALSVQFLGEEGAETELQSFVETFWHYVIELMGHRSRTMSKFSVGPEAYAKLLGNDGAAAADARRLMLSDWKCLWGMESSVNRDPQELAADLRDAISKPLRLAMQLQETNRPEEAREILQTLLIRLPDSKLVEDLHQRLRTEAKANAQQSLRPRELQGLIQTSNALESRNILHPARLTRDVFMEQWKTTKTDYNFKKSFDSGTVKLPEFFSRMMAPKKWRTLSEETLSFSSGAWAWVREYVSKNLKEQGVVVKETWLRFYTVICFC